MKPVDALMQEALLKHVFPGGVLLIAKEGSIRFHKSYGYANIFSKEKMTKKTVFDLASLTKPLATTLAIMKLMQKSLFNLDLKLGYVIPEFERTEKRQITLRHLLSHCSGFPAHRPYYIQLSKLLPEMRTVALRDLLLNEPLLHPIGKNVLYSDLGFMVLRWVVETVVKKRLDHFVSEEIYQVLGGALRFKCGLFFADLSRTPPKKKFAATELCRWRNCLVNGVVHDRNAYALGGIEGHAGLFGTAEAVHMLLSELLSTFSGGSSTGIFNHDMVRRFFTRQQNSEYALGFDMPSKEGPSCGKYFSRNSVGHLGFTGTSFWIDPDRSVIVILLTNRIHPRHENMKIKTFRPKLHDAVMKELA